MSRNFKIALVASLIAVGYVVGKVLTTPQKKEEKKTASKTDVPAAKRPN